MDDKRSLIIGLNSTFMTVSIVAITTRLLTRIFLIKRVGVDDVLITIALFLALAHASMFILSVRYGEGLHIQYLDPANVPAYTQAMLLSGLWYNLCQMFIKLSYLTFYLRLAVSRSFRITLYVSIAMVSAFGIATSIVCMALCMPWEKLWHPDTPGRCLDIQSYYISVSALNVVFDLAIFILPVPTLWGLKLPKRQRVCLTGVFALGLIVVIASIIRLRALVIMLHTPAYRKDNTWSTVDSLNWSTVEVHLALLISCTAAFKALIQRYFPALLGTLSATKQTSSRNQYNFNTRGGGCLRQPRSHGEPDFKTVMGASIHEVLNNGSEEHIVEDLEMSGYNTTVSIPAPSEASINGDVIEGRSPVGST